MNKTATIMSLAFAAAFTAHSAKASDAIGPGDRDARWLVGGGVVTSTNIYAGESNSSTVNPNFVFNGDRIFIKAGSLNYSVKEWGSLSAGLTASLDGNFLSSEEEYRSNPELSGLTERDATVGGGFYINHTTDLGRLNFSYLTDIGDKHDGQSASLQYTFDLKMGNWYVNPVLGATWISAEKVNHYFGVSSAEQTSSRLSYEGESTANLFAGVRARYEINDRWDLNLRTGATRFGSGITDSSIVDDKTSYYSSVSLNFNF